MCMKCTPVRIIIYTSIETTIFNIQIEIVFMKRIYASKMHFIIYLNLSKCLEITNEHLPI